MMVATMPARKRGTPLNHPLRLWREAHNISQDELADACHISQPMISYIEADKRVPLRDALERLHAYTGLPADAFVRWRRFMEEVGGEEGFLRKYGPRRRGRRPRPPAPPEGDA